MLTLQELKFRYPNLFRDVTCGICYPEYWEDVLLELADKLEPMLVEWKYNNPEQVVPRCVQVKTKWGRFTFYMDGYLPGMLEAIEIAVEEANSVRPSNLPLY